MLIFLLPSHSSLQRLEYNIPLIQEHEPVGLTFFLCFPFGILYRGPLQNFLKSENVSCSHRFRSSLVRLVWTAACSLAHAAEGEAALRPDTLIPSTPKLSQYSAAA